MGAQAEGLALKVPHGRFQRQAAHGAGMAPAKKAKATKATSAKARPAKKAPRKTAKPATKKAASRFGRSGTAGKGEGDEAVQAWMAGVKPGQRALVRRIDGIIGEEVPGVRRGVKWSMPMYGLPGQGWLVHVGSFKDHVAVGFFSGTSLDPQPPHGESGHMRRATYGGEGDLDERRLRSWLRQARDLPGWGKV
jgi:hypothetical protein